MQEALDLLEHQPKGWPKWAAGKPGNSMHLFIFEEHGHVDDVRLGDHVPVCRFVDGAEFVEMDPEKWLDPEDSICFDCWKVILYELDYE